MRKRKASKTTCSATVTLLRNKLNALQRAAAAGKKRRRKATTSRKKQKEMTYGEWIKSVKKRMRKSPKAKAVDSIMKIMKAGPQ